MSLVSVLLSVLIVLTFLSTSISSKAQADSGRKGFPLASSAFAPGASIPKPYTCSGADHSPELHWGDPPAHSTIPPGTKTFALIMDDPDAPSGTWVHWTVWNMPSTVHEIAMDFPREAERPDGTRQGRNDFGKVGYNGPCPPAGKTHRYLFRVYAVDAKLDLAPGATRAELDSALKGHVLAEVEYMGTYRR